MVQRLAKCRRYTGIGAAAMSIETLPPRTEAARLFCLAEFLADVCIGKRVGAGSSAKRDSVSAASTGVFCCSIMAAKTLLCQL